MRALFACFLLIPALTAAPRLQLSNIPLSRGVRLVRTDGTNDYGSVQRVTTQFVSFVSQRSGQCENIEISDIASIKAEGPKPRDKFSPAEAVFMAPIALPYFAAYELKHIFTKKGLDNNHAMNGQWQSGREPDGTVTSLDVEPRGIEKSFANEKDGTYRVTGPNLSLTYSPDQNGIKKEDVLPIHFGCGTLIAGSGQPFDFRRPYGTVEAPIVGRWETNGARNVWEFRPDNSFRIADVQPGRYSGRFHRVNGGVEILWDSPVPGQESWTIRKQNDQLIVVHDGTSTVYKRRREE